MDPSDVEIPDVGVPAVRLGLLGPLVVEIDGVERRVAAPRQRALLARLALQPGVAVSADRLLDDVWGDAYPSTGRKSVAYQISKLRTALEPHRTDTTSIITTSAAGYALSIEPEEIDALRFERLVADARDALATDPARCVGLADEALSLWRGPALADLGDEPFVEPEVRRLQERREAVRTIAAEARIELGAATEAVADLVELADERPLDETLVGLLMVALDRAGRPGDALHAYGDLRHRLAEELGIEPARWLQQLEGEIIDRVPPSGSPISRTAPGRGPRPVPTAVSSFVGRDDEIADVAATLSVSRLVTLCGFGGIGKTRLAHEVARRVADRFTHGVWYADLVPVTDIGMLAETIARSGGLTLPAGPDPVDRLSAVLQERDLLVVLDNCEHLADVVAELVVTILPAAPAVRVLATSRVGLGVAGEATWTVPGLDPASAARLFTDRARPARPDEADAVEQELVTRVVRRLDGIPLAIEMAAARSSTMGLAQIDAHLFEVLQTSRPPAREADRRHGSLDTVLEWSYRLLDEDDRVLLRRLSVCVGGFDLDAAVRIGADGGATMDSTVKVLDHLGHLVDTAMVTFDECDGLARYRLLEAVRRFVGRRMDVAERDDASRRHASHYRTVAARIEELCDADFNAAVRVGELEIGNLRAAMGWAFGGGDPRSGLAIALDTRSFFYTHSLPRESLTWLRAGLAATDGDDEDGRLLAAAAIVLQAFNVMDLEVRRSAALEVARGLETTRDPQVRAELLNAIAAHESDTSPRTAELHTLEAIALDASPPHRTLALLCNRIFSSWEIGSISGAEEVLRRVRALPLGTIGSNPGVALVEAGIAARAGRWHDVLRTTQAKNLVDPGHAALIGLFRAEALGVLGQHDRAVEELESIDASLVGHDRWWAGLVAASIDLRRGAAGRAARRLGAMASEIAPRGRLAVGMQVAALLGVAAFDLGQPAAAATLLGHADGERCRLDIELRISDRELVARATDGCSARLGDERFALLSRRGAELALGELPVVGPQATFPGC